jgi:hypothetical protein
MGSWKPRPPSAKVKEQLGALRSAMIRGVPGGGSLNLPGGTPCKFAGEEAPVACAPSGWHAPARWLAPAMACLFFAGAGLSARHSPIGYWSAPSTNMLWEGSLFQQPGYAAYIAGAGHTFQNHSPARFEIRGGISLNGISSLNTNKLIR